MIKKRKDCIQIMQTQKYTYNGDNVYFISNTQNNIFIFYAPTFGILMNINKPLYKKMTNALNNNLSKFPEFEVLLNEQFKQRLPMDFDITKLKSSYFHLALGLTENCTLGCLYCHADAGEDNQMSTELLDASIQYAIDQASNQNLKGVNTSFAVGGEPTYNLSLLKRAVSSIKQKCKEKNLRSVISMTTNAYYNEDIANYIAKNIDNILISLDGLAEIQNKHRPSRNKKPTFETVIKATDIIFKEKGHLSIRSTVSNESLKQLNDFISFLFERYGNNINLVLEPLVPLGRGASLNETSIIQAPNLNEFEKYFWEAYIYGQKLGIRVSSSSLKRERLASGFCGAMFIPSFTVTTKGIITTCERDKTGENYGYAHYDFNNKTFIFNQKAIDRNKNLVQLPSKCNDCICLYHCAGDCPDARNIGYNRCQLNQNLLIKELCFELLGKEVHLNE